MGCLLKTKTPSTKLRTETDFLRTTNKPEWHESTHVISLPPLSLGGFHDKVTLDPVTSSYSSGASGGEGRSEMKVIL